MFDKPNPAGNQPTAPNFGLNNPSFGQNNAPTFGQNGPSFGQNTSLSGQTTSLFGVASTTQSFGGFSGNAQTTSLFGNQNQQNQNPQPNFFSSFNPNAAGGFPPVSDQDTSSMMKPRK